MDSIFKYFSNSTSRNIHSRVMLILAKALGEISSKQSLFAEVIELTNFGGLLHSNILDNSNATSILHKLLGNRGMILGGDYMLSNA